MTTYYVRKSGDDSNAGTSPAAAWATFDKALGATGGTSGDTVYVGPGIYREIVTVNAAAAGVVIAGDPLGEQTGDVPGEVILSGYPTGPFAAAAASPLITANSVDGVTLRNLRMVVGSQYGVSLFTTQNWTIERCVITGMASSGSTSGGVNCVTAYGEDQGLVIRDCMFAAMRYGLRAWMDRGAAGDYDANIQVMRCFFEVQQPVCVETQGAGANYGGGIDVANCTCVDPEYWLLKTVATTISTSIPCTIKDSISIFGGMVSASAAGQVTDGGGNIGSVANANFTAHATSRYEIAPIVEVLYSIGHEWLWGLPSRRPFSVLPGSAAVGYTGTETMDLGNATSAFDGSSVYGDTGTCTSANSDDLSDSTKAWGVNQWKGWLVAVTGGSGSGQVKRIGSNTATELDISGAAPAGGLWATTPDATSTYIIYQGPPVETGKATSGSDTTVVDSGANWVTNQWAGYTVAIGAESQTVISNTATTLTTASWTTDPTTGDNYSIYKGSLTAVQAAPGTMPAHDTGRPATISYNGVTTGYVLDGYASQEFLVPVKAALTTLSVPVMYDSNHGTGSKPQVTIVADPTLGITGSTSTVTAAADTWETVVPTSFTPTAAGYVRVRIQARSATPYGKVSIAASRWNPAFAVRPSLIMSQFQLRPMVT